MLRTLTHRAWPVYATQNAIRHSSTKAIPFDTEPFPFKRFEPCCPDPDPQGQSRHFENGFVPCKKHPMPNVIGGKIDMVSDFRQGTLARHMVVCVGPDGDEWQRSKSETVRGGMLHAMDTARQTWLQENPDIQRDMNNRMLATACDRPSASPWPTSDIILFPDFRRFPAVDPTTVHQSDAPFHCLLSTLWKNAATDKLPDVTYDDMEGINTVVLVCTHTMRDKRCGVLGPLLVDEFRRCLQEQGLWSPSGRSQVEVWGTSHIGGHKFSGNVVIHQRGLGGHMYGNVRQCHVPSIIDRHIKNGKVIRDLWRSTYSMIP